MSISKEKGSKVNKEVGYDLQIYKLWLRCFSVLHNTLKNNCQIVRPTLKPVTQAVIKEEDIKFDV